MVLSDCLFGQLTARSVSEGMDVSRDTTELRRARGGLFQEDPGRR
jgi:hypothetical protein